jgi:hypothetical protein
MTEVEKLSEAIAAASAYPAALKQLNAAWAELLNTLCLLGIPLPSPEGTLTWDIVGGKVSNVRARNAYHADEPARALIELVPAFVEHLERVAQTARDALVVADALRKALADERVQAALTMRALEK